jgi:lipoate synthase
VMDDTAVGDGSIPGLPAGLTKPPWLRQRAPQGDKYKQISADVRGLGLATVCEGTCCVSQIQAPTFADCPPVITHTHGPKD